MRNFMKRLKAAALAICIGALFNAAQAQDVTQQLTSASVIEKIKQRGSLVVGLATFVPWAMLDKNGQLIGFEIDVARQLAKDMGVEVEFQPTAWDGIIPALIAGKFDVIISGMSVTTQRNLTVNFTDPYAYSGLRVILAAGAAAGVSSLDDLNRPEVTLALRRGATPVTWAQAHLPNAKILQFDEEPATLQEVLNGNATGTIASEPSPSWWMTQYPDKLAMPVDDLLDASAEAFALRKGDPDALNFFNNWIAARWRDGFLQDRHDYWFRSRAWADQVAAQ
ncbi:MAG: transporter substrate-binding domain-containing protein [Geminicoccaceae bacterium]